jgi:beta-lactamase regulating signal transducer with metallopeptidase domain
MSSISLLIQSLGWALLHSIWQGALVFVGMYIVIKALGKRLSRLKYILSYASLLFLFAWFISTCLAEWQKMQSVSFLLQEPGAMKNFTVNVSASAGDHPRSIMSLVVNAIEHFLPLVTYIYFIGLGIMLMRFTMGIWQMRSIRQKGIVPSDDHWRHLLSGLQIRLNLTKPVKLLFSDYVNIPMMVGTLKPVILLPFTALNDLTTDQIEAILLHELAHIKRYDYMLNIFQTAIETLMFFNPFVWLLSSIVKREREHCCDDIVVAHTRQPLLYAHALTTLETTRINSGKLAMAAVGEKNQLFNRIKRITEMNKSSLNYGYLLLVLLIAIALIISVSRFSPATAQTKKAKNSTQSDTTSTTVRTKKITIIDDNGNKSEYDSYDEMSEKDRKKLKDALGDNIKIPGFNDGDNNTNKTYKPAQTKKIKRVVYTDNDTTIDLTKVAHDALASFNWEQLMNLVDLSVLNNVEKSIKDAEKIASDPKMKKEIQEQIEKARKEIEKAKEEMRKAREQMKEAKIELDENSNVFDFSNNASATTNNSSSTSTITTTKTGKTTTTQTINFGSGKYTITTDEFEAMINEMQSDGLLTKSDGYTVKKKDGNLFIDGIKQSEEVYKKYKHYLQGANVSITGDENNMNVKSDNLRMEISHHN